MKKTSVYECSIVELSRHHHEKGNITVVENSSTIPFEVRRTYYLYDIPGGESRTFVMNRPYQGLLIVPGIWRTLEDFSSGSVCLVLASEKYEESDYIRDYEEFIKYKNV